MENIKPCPFCGPSDVSVVRTGGKSGIWQFYAVECPECGGSGPSRGDEESAVSGWNFRYPLPEDGWLVSGEEVAALMRERIAASSPTIHQKHAKTEVPGRGIREDE